MTLAQSVLPEPKEIRDLLVELLVRDVTLGNADAWAPLPHEGAVVAEFIDDRDRVAAIAVADISFTGFVGSAIGLLPIGGARDMIDEGRLSAMVVENVYEVLNVMSSLFNKEGHTHVRIGVLHGPGGPLPGELPAIARRLTSRLDVSVEVAGYGKGRLGFVLA
jgi:hypothetical protein